MFKVTCRDPQDPAGTVEASYTDDDTFVIHESGALIITRPTEEITYAPGTWLMVRQPNGDALKSTGNYL